MVNESQFRSRWTKERILATYHGKNHVVIAAPVRTPRNAMLCLLEDITYNKIIQLKATG